MLKNLNNTQGKIVTITSLFKTLSFEEIMIVI